MTVKISVSTNIKVNAKNAEKLYETNVLRHLNRVANNFRNNILLGMQRTPKDMDNPIQKSDTVIHFPSKRGNPPAIDTGNLASSIRINPARTIGKNYQASVSTDVEYAESLDNPKLKNRPFMRKGSRPYEATVDYARRIMNQISIRKQFRPIKVSRSKKGVVLR